MPLEGNCFESTLLMRLSDLGLVIPQCALGFVSEDMRIQVSKKFKLAILYDSDDELDNPRNQVSHFQIIRVFGESHHSMFA